jgi:hypothetical protein
MKQMKHRILLEHLIRKALHEQGGTIVVEASPFNAEEEKLMKDLHDEILGVTQQAQITYTTADGTAILISRRGGRDDDKKFELSSDELKNRAIAFLNTIRGGLNTKTSSDYVWVLDMQDTKLGKRKKPKEERLFATYRFPAFYISRSLIAKPITASTTGYIGTIGKGAMLFDRAKIKDTEWKYTVKTGDRIDKPDQISGVTSVPRSELEFGDSNSSVLKLFRYFYSDTTASSQLDNLASVKNSNKFGCELRAACEQFQKEQGLGAITGKWDSASIAKAEQLYQANINKLDPTETPNASYVFATPADLKTRIATCELETKPKDKYIEFIPYNSRNDSTAVKTKFTKNYFLEKSEDPSTWDSKTVYEFQQFLRIVLSDYADVQEWLSVKNFLKAPISQYGTWGTRSKALLNDLNVYTGKTPVTNWSHDLTTALFGISTNAIKTGTNESRIKNSNIYNKLYEQLVPANQDVIKQIATTDNPNPVVVVKKDDTKKDTNTTPKKDDTKKDSEPKKDKGKSIERSKKLTPQATYQWKLISNSIKFIEAINSVKRNNITGIDEEAVYRIIKKYLIPNSKDKNSAAYTDMIIRLLYGNLRYLTKKYPKQVKYFITRNGSTGTTIEYLQGIQPYYLDYQSLTGLLYRNGERLGLDNSTEEAKGVRRLLSQLYNPKFAFIDGVTPKLNLTYSAKQVYDRIAFAYENTIWGTPGGKRKNLPER